MRSKRKRCVELRPRRKLLVWCRMPCTRVDLDSDFWHGWQYPRWKHLLKDDFWRGKISKNRQRDIRNKRLLKQTGWKVIRIWEHQIKHYPEKAIDRILSALYI